MQVKVFFLMEDRSEYTFDVDAPTANDIYDIAVYKLNKTLCTLESTSSKPTGWNKIESWRIVTKSTNNDGAITDKTDGLAMRSSLQKIRYDLLPLGPLTEVARVFTFGAYNYGDRNWEEGFSWSRCIGSAFRHFVKWCLGEDNDDESGLNHLAHTIANCLFLLQYTFTKRGTDDRVKLPIKTIKELFESMQCTITTTPKNKEFNNGGTR